MARSDDGLTIQVLAVDADQDTLDTLDNTLTSLGYQVNTAVNGELALDMTREQSYDIVLCDLHLVGMNGLQFVHAMGRMHPQTPVILIIGQDDVAASREALAAGASDFMTRPLEFNELPLTIEKNLQRKQSEQQRLSEQRADVLFKAIKALAAAIDAKSYYTGSHSARMAEMCLEIGRAMGLSQQRLNTLELSAYIHDVGKIGTPDSVLTKCGKLSDEEWADILRHPAMGADFLAGIDELAEVATVIRHHHEHVDGSGYPDGLKGDAIPLLARILAAADAVEAMTSERPYRAALSLEAALYELREHSGTQFDPDVVDATIGLIGEKIAGDRRKAA